MGPESVEIKGDSGRQQRRRGNQETGASDGQAWRVLFCEDVTTGVAPLTPLLDIGVVLRARKKSGIKGDSAIKLRPCRWSQLSDDFFANRKNGTAELKIEADWAGSKRSLTASLTTKWDKDRVDAVRSGRLRAAGLFDEERRRFLQDCSNGRVNFEALVALADSAAARWKNLLRR
jgi:hypothetical protein